MSSASPSPPMPPPRACEPWSWCALASNIGSSWGFCVAPPSWSCARCTFLNPDSSRECSACGTARPVEVEADEDTARSPQLRRCAKKRERASSPDIAEVCVDEGGADFAHVDKIGKLETPSYKKTLKIMTYNVWFREDIELPRRMDAIGDLIQQHSPDLICLQEVTPLIHQLLQKSDWWPAYKCLLSHENAMRRHYFCMQMSKLRVRTSNLIPFKNSTMGRELCIATVDAGPMTKLMFATSHLESPAPPRWDQTRSEERIFQANESLRTLGNFRNVIFCGDMNWDDNRDGPFPLPDGWVDAWIKLKPGKKGWTYDTKANGMLSANRKVRKRMDRFVCNLADFTIDCIELIGKKAIPGASYSKDKIVGEELHEVKLPVLPSSWIDRFESQ